MTEESLDKKIGYVESTHISSPETGNPVIAVSDIKEAVAQLKGLFGAGNYRKDKIIKGINEIFGEDLV